MYQVTEQMPVAKPWPGTDPLLDIDPTAFRVHYNREPFLFRHRLVEHPLLQLESLVDLINRLPADHVMHCRGRVSVDSDMDDALRKRAHQYSLQDVMRDLQNADAWVLIYQADADPAYRSLLHQLLGEIRPLVEEVDPGMCDEAAYIFIVSPGAVTPYHMDRETNFLCQVRGTKVMQLWDHTDPSIMAQEDFERLFARPNLPKPAFKPEYAVKARSFELGPGTGVHHPFTAPHAAQCGDDISIAIALTFRSRSMRRQITLHQANAALRRAGIRPQPLGASPGLDTLKQQGYRAYRQARSVLGRLR